MEMNDRLVHAFYQAAVFLKHKVENEGWHWSSNYLREHVRCATGMKFSNSLSPQILRQLRARYPSMKSWVRIETLFKD